MTDSDLKQKMLDQARYALAKHFDDSQDAAESNKEVGVVVEAIYPIVAEHLEQRELILEAADKLRIQAEAERDRLREALAKICDSVKLSSILFLQ